MTNLRKALTENRLEDFISEREPLDVPKKPLQRYIDASATPLDNRKASQLKSKPDFSADCK